MNLKWLFLGTVASATNVVFPSQTRACELETGVETHPREGQTIPSNGNVWLVMHADLETLEVEVDGIPVDAVLVPAAGNDSLLANQSADLGFVAIDADVELEHGSTVRIAGSYDDNGSTGSFSYEFPVGEPDIAQTAYEGETSLKIDSPYLRDDHTCLEADGARVAVTLNPPLSASEGQHAKVVRLSVSDPKTSNGMSMTPVSLETEVEEVEVVVSPEIDLGSACIHANVIDATGFSQTLVCQNCEDCDGSFERPVYAPNDWNLSCSAGSTQLSATALGFLFAVVGLGHRRARRRRTSRE